MYYQTVKILWITSFTLIKDFFQTDIYYTDTDSLYIEHKYWIKSKNDYKNGGFFYGLLLALKIKYCITINRHGIIDEHKFFEGFTNVSDK